MRSVHFVGSVALHTPAEVFEAIGRRCAPYLKRVPDGEPGGRRLWISWQIPVLRANPLLAQVGDGQIPLKLADGASGARIHFGELGYAREARPSYEDFVAARRAGHIADGVRFQVSLPTPWAVVMPFCVQPDAQQILPVYEDAMLREVASICARIPHQDLAIQWDVCIEMLAWDGRWANAPLGQLQLAATTELYLGLVHVKDGVSGSAARAAAARRHRRDFGIASECGISRGRDPNLALDFIDVYAKTAAAS